MALVDRAEGGVPTDAALRASPDGAPRTSPDGAPRTSPDAAPRASQGGNGPLRPRGGPLDPRLIRRAAATRWYLAAGVAIGCAVAALTVTQAWALSRGIAAAFASDAGAAAWAIPVLLGVFGGKALLTWLNTFLAQRAAAAVKSQLRTDLVRARLARPLDAGSSAAGLVALATQGLDALDGFYARYLPQLLLAVTVPLIVGVAILTADLGSAVLVALTLPLIPLFLALVGWTTEARTRRRWDLQQRLARHFADLVAGLPTLQVFGRAKAQAIGLRRTEDASRAETMATLRISFLSALVLELLATLSVAVVAVTVGFRVVFGELDLATALFVLILAPEAYLPVRQVGVHYHDSADGMAAAQSAFELIDPPDADGAAPPNPFTGESSPAGLVSVRGLTHTYPGAAAPAVSDVSFDVAPGAFVVVTGPSGGGKTTVLNALMGFLTPTAGAILTGTTDPAAWRRRTAYVGQEPGMVSGTVADNVRLGRPGATDAEARDALVRAGAAGMALDTPVGDEGEGLSAGERRRVATARAILRIEAGADLLVLDEPTAGLDADAEATLLAGLRRLGVAAVLVSHRPAVLAQADVVVRIGGGS